MFATVVNAITFSRVRRTTSISKPPKRRPRLAATVLAVIAGASAPLVSASVVSQMHGNYSGYFTPQNLMPWSSQHQHWYGDKKPTIPMNTTPPNTGSHNIDYKYPPPNNDPLPTGSGPVVSTTSGDSCSTSGCSSSCCCGCMQGGPCTCHHVPPPPPPPPMCNPTSPNVPEPATISLAGLASLLLLRRRSRR